MILVRHAQTVFNVVFGAHRRDPGVRDPALTEEGHAQALAAAEMLGGNSVTRVIASPYWRALQTAEIVAGALSVPVEVEPLVRERAAFACDIGTPRSRLAESWSEYAFHRLDEVWWAEAEEAESVLHDRCRKFCRNMSTREDWPHVAVVTHWGVIKALTGKRVQNCETVRLDPTLVTSIPADGG
ncbi:MAG: histidine phosphatase family protein [Rhodospirillales bacterium]|nr:histidine phosphatase family protein [Rhodospirillales bacterium]